jgi:hypothetical protein
MTDELLQRVAYAAKRRQTFTDDLHALIREAFEAGLSGSKIADAAGLSTPRVYQIRDGR